MNKSDGVVTHFSGVRIFHLLALSDLGELRVYHRNVSREKLFVEDGMMRPTSCQKMGGNGRSNACFPLHSLFSRKKGEATQGLPTRLVDVKVLVGSLKSESGRDWLPSGSQ